MSYTLFNSTSAATDLIAQPGRSVNTFPSGLVRVDQVYLGLTANAAAHRAILAVGNDMPDGDTSPCIDGLKIFPETQERRREDGWTEYIVSAYGRNKTTATVSKKVILYSVGAMSIFRNSADAQIVSASFPSMAELAFPTGSFDPLSATYNNDAAAAESGTFQVSADYGWSTIYDIVFPSVTFTRAFFAPGVVGTSSSALKLPLNLTSRNFGYWTEWIFAYG